MSINLGKTKDKEYVNIDSKTRSTHMHIIGSTGEGKSKFIEHMIREDILNRRGICLIDPHGYLYNDLVNWAETYLIFDNPVNRKIILFDPSENKWAFGFNPLQVSSPDIAFHVDAMVKAVAKVWGGEDTDKTPLLKRCLRILFHVLAEKQLSLIEAQPLINPTQSEVRKYLTEDIKDSVIREQWDYFNVLKPKPFYEEFGSTINRMMEFLASPIVRATVGQLKSTIDFRKIMDEGWVLLVNLKSADRISDDNARLLGTLIVNDLFMKAKARPEKSRPFYLYIDECARFINEDIGRILDEGRKFGLHLILAHQHLAQLKKVGEDIYHSIMTDAKTKVIFGGLSAEDARVLAEQIFLGELDLEEQKESLKPPAVVKYVKTWLENYSRGSSSGASGSSGTTKTSTDNWGQAISRGPDGLDKSIQDSYGSAVGAGAVDNSGWVDTETESTGEMEAIKPILGKGPGPAFSLEEQIYKAMALMVNQSQQCAIIKLPKQKTKMVKTPYVKSGYANEQRVERFKTNCYELADFAKPRIEVEEELETRLKMLEDKAREYIEKDLDPDTFRT